jgi:hypothetical protein
MKINGNFIGSISGHSQMNSALVDRFVEIYATKTKLKFYLFNSSIMNWHKKTQVIRIFELKTDKVSLSNVTIGLAELTNVNGVILNGYFRYKNFEVSYRNGQNQSKVLHTTKENVREKTIDCLNHVYPTLVEKLDNLLDSGAINFEEYEDNYILPKLIVQALGGEMTRLYSNPHASRAEKRDLKNIQCYI